MPAKLIIESDIDKNRTELVFDKPRITLGRRAGNDLHFNRPEISGNHAAFLLEAGLCYIQDLGSTNGTLLNGAPVVANEKYPLQDQDLITIAPYRITFIASRDMSSTMLESNALKDLRQAAGSGTVYEKLDRVATGTSEQSVPDLGKSKAKGTGTEPDIQPTFGVAAAAPQPAPPPEPEPAPAPAPAPPPKPAPARLAPRPAPAPVEPEDLEPGKEPSALPDYIWLAIGGIVLIVAIVLLAFIFLA